MTDETTRSEVRASSPGMSVFDVLAREPDVDPTVKVLVDRLRLELLNPSRPSDLPFLSVLLRTRGMRLEPLEDALLCLAAQTDQDFEVILVDHDSDVHGAAGVRHIVDSQPEWFREKISVIEVKGGTRSRPLNEAVKHARGHYVAVYDDDDLLFGDWVEKFHVHADEAGGRLLRSHVATQKVATELWNRELDGFRTLSWPNAEYARNFDQVDHLLINHSPFMSIAFPRTAFSKLGFAFDEELAVCEDWDLILRTSLVLGVMDVQALTAIYRRWQNASSSYTEHSREQWLESEAKVIDRLDRSAIVLPPGSVKQIRGMLQTYNPGLEQELELLKSSRSWKVTRPLRFVTNRAFRVRGTFLHHRNRIIARLKGK